MVTIDALATKKSAMQAVGVYVLTIVMFAFLCITTTLFIPARKNLDIPEKSAIPESAVVLEEKPAVPEKIEIPIDSYIVSAEELSRDECLFWS
jgi:hypothetical protein